MVKQFRLKEKKIQSARQNAPEMLKLFQQRKETIKNKHISLLKVRKGTKRETKTTRNGNIDTKK